MTPQDKPPITADQIEEFILNQASVKQVENIFQCLGTRFKELASKQEMLS